MNRPDPQSSGAIFFEIVDSLELSLKKAGRPRAFKDARVANDLRGLLFKLEGWAKIHRDWPLKKERKIFESLRFCSKALEDALGTLDLAREMQDVLRTKKEPDLVCLFEDQEKAERKKLKHLLKSQDWFSDGETRTEKMRQQLLKIDWPSATAQFDFLARALISDMTALGVRYRESLRTKILQTPLDRRILENDLHKFRRQLRWFSMYVQTADGMIRLGPTGERLTNEKRKLVADYQANPFAQISKRKPVRAYIDPIAFYEITRLVEKLGEVKDEAERYFMVRDRLLESGVAEPEAAERARQLFGPAPTDTPIAARRILDEYERLKPLSYLAESLADGR